LKTDLYQGHRFSGAGKVSAISNSQPLRLPQHPAAEQSAEKLDSAASGAIKPYREGCPYRNAGSAAPTESGFFRNPNSSGNK